jgi:protein TonB
LEADGTKVSGHRYEATGDDRITYAVWSLKDPSNVGKRLSREDYRSELFHGEALYLDLIADLAWELLVRDELESFRNGKGGKFPEMIYSHEFKLDGKPAREYSLRLRKEVGLVYVCADGPRMYVVAAHGADASVPQLKQFVESFNVKMPPPKLPVPPSSGMGTGSGVGIGPGKGYNVGGGGPSTSDKTDDYNRPFRQAEVTQKALITYKPEPGFTESARRFNVTGTVRLRAILNKTGEVTNIAVIKGLPHGLTATALNAARQIKFQPAQKDGHTVSQYVVLDYNYNIY